MLYSDWYQSPGFHGRLAPEAALLDNGCADRRKENNNDPMVV